MNFISSFFFILFIVKLSLIKTTEKNETIVDDDEDDEKDYPKQVQEIVKVLTAKAKEAREKMQGKKSNSTNTHSKKKKKQENLTSPLKSIYEILGIKDLSDDNLFWKAKNYYFNNDYKQAYSLLKKIKTVRSTFSANLIASKVFYKFNELSKSLHSVEECLDRNEDEDLIVLKINILIEMKNIEEASKTLEKYKSLISKSNFVALIEKLKEKKNSLLEARNENPKVFNDYISFLKWLYKGGAFINKIDINFQTPSNRTIVALDDINKDETILRIPKNLIINLDLAKEANISKLITNASLNRILFDPTKTYFALYLLEEQMKGSLSKFEYYLKLLPSKVKNFPVYYDKKEQEILNGTKFLKKVKSKIQDLEEDFQLLRMGIPEFKKYGFYSLKRLLALVSSRIFGVKIHNKKEEILVPFADMFNYNSKSIDAHWTYSDEEEAFIVTSNRDIKKGEEIFVSYGKHSNSVLLRNYGFLVEDNYYGVYSIKINVTNTTKFFKDIKKVKFNLNKNISSNTFQSMLTFLRHMYNGDDYKECKTKLKKPSPIINVKNEILVLKKVKGIFRRKLKKFNSTIEDDLAMLKMDNLTENERNCYIIRMQERLVVKYFLDFAETALKFIESSKENRNFEKYENYLKELAVVIDKEKLADPKIDFVSLINI